MINSNKNHLKLSPIARMTIKTLKQAKLMIKIKSTIVQNKVKMAKVTTRSPKERRLLK
jgi:hypothetical protein